MADHLLNWNEAPEVEVRPGVTTKTIPGAHASLVMVRIAGGIAAPRHAHPHEQFVQVISGTGTLETDAGRRSFGPGSIFHFPADTLHAASFDTDTILVETNLRTSVAG